MVLGPIFGFLRPALGVIILLKSTKNLTVSHVKKKFGPHVKSGIIWSKDSPHNALYPIEKGVLLPE
jgi:hypothetical protein